MIDFLSAPWAVRDSWKENPDHAARIKRAVSVVLAQSPADTVVPIGNFHPQGIEHQERALAVARHIVDLHNAALG